ncbi:MAG: hypothetical protein ACYC2O_05860 [Microthrixaceae bacterium]
MTEVRVLQVLGSTDATALHLAALELHAQLASSGVAVRTLAIAPGRQGELAESIPTMAPGRRSLAAVTQLRAEQRWADVVLLQGAAVATVAGWAGGHAVPLLALSDEPPRWAAGGRVPWAVRRLARRASAVVVATADDVAPTAARLGVVADRIVVAPPPRQGAQDTLAWWLDTVRSALPSRA